MIKEPKDIKGDVKEIFTPFGELIAENLAEELEAKGGLLVPKESYVKNYTQKIVHAIEEGLEKRKNHLQRAAKILEIEHAALPKVEKERLEEEMKTILQKMASSVNQREEKKEKTISFLSKETLIWIYQIGSAYAAKGLQEDALAIFQMLTILHPDSSDFWVAQGIIEKTLHQESDALISFSMAIAANPKNPAPYYNMALIYHDLHNQDEAQKALQSLEAVIKSENRTDLQSSLNHLKEKIQESQGGGK